ncbi:MAG: rhomboid protease GluP [Patiriisocius sp.]|jgi:rhomboid protease GluP
MALGFTPKHREDLNLEELSTKHALILAIETVKKLNWNIGPLSENGFVAYTKFSMSSWSEEVRIKIEEGIINITSQCAGNQLIDWGKNKRNTDSFILAFNALRAENNPEEIEAKFSELEKNSATEEGPVIIKPPLSENEKASDIFTFFKPRQGYYVAPILLYINSIIFILMVITGVNIMLPDSASLLTWGANFRPVTLDGEWWRLLSSCFLHIGVFHLLMNMYALLYIGLLLEPYLGKSRFLSAYLITGIAGSAASLYWNDLTISAGASGAIFGMYGVFLAMLTTNLIEKAARKAFITSIAVFIGYNLLNGLQGGIDNAAHIGGLISGLIVGYSFYPSLIKPNLTKLKFRTIGLLSLLVLAAASIVLLTTTPGETGKYDKEMEKFVRFEEKALRLYHMSETSTDQEYLDEIRNNGIPSWESNLQLLDRVEQFELPALIHERNHLLKEYCNLRIKSYELIHKAIFEGSEIYQPEIEVYNQEIQSIIDQLGEQ